MIGSWDPAYNGLEGGSCLGTPGKHSFSSSKKNFVNLSRSLFNRAKSAPCLEQRKFGSRCIWLEKMQPQIWNCLTPFQIPQTALEKESSRCPSLLRTRTKCPRGHQMTPPPHRHAGRDRDCRLFAETQAASAVEWAARSQGDECSLPGDRVARYF